MDYSKKKEECIWRKISRIRNQMAKIVINRRKRETNKFKNLKQKKAKIIR